jgi:NodT family efflux transporter outer membrane factor (OMF) lipoprotein
MTATANRIARRWCVLLTGIALSSCSLAPHYKPPKIAEGASYKEAPATPQPDVGAWRAAAPADDQPRGPWWSVFADPELDQLEQRAFAANQNLAAAAARYRQARAVADAASAQLFPAVDIAASGERERISRNAPTNLTGRTRMTTDLVLRAQTSYELDFWGRIRNTAAAARARAKASAADLATAHLSLQAELAGDYVELRGMDSQIALLVSAVDAYGRALEITQNRYKGGAAPIGDVDQASTQLETARVQLADTRLARAQMEHAIAILLGVTPSQFGLTPASLNIAPPVVTPGLPSHLLERRPDVASAERQTFAANAEIGVARAAWFPTFSLNAGFGFEGTNTGNWIQAPSQTWSLGPAALLNLLDWGQRRAQNAQARAAYDEAVANYRETVIEAYGQVEDQLAAVHWLDDQLDAQQRAVQSSQNALDQANYRYKGGVANYLEVVVAQNAALQARQVDLNLRVRRLVAALQLIKALGGDWSPAQLTKPIMPPRP